MWVIERAASRVVLFGETVGLRREDAWLTDDIRDAVEASRELWREADREELARSPLLLAATLADEPLSQRLDDAERRSLDMASAQVGVDPATLEGLRPWAAGQVLEEALRSQAGVDGALGVDSVITGLARAAGVPVLSELGDPEATFAWFAGMGRKLELEYLMWTVDRVAAGAAEMDRQVAAWMEGDLAVSEQQDRVLRRDHLRLHDRLLVERNRAWVPRIESMLAGPGSAFVLVGGAHLVGEHSILALARASGLVPRRVR